jgi:hypothetical protein
MFVTCVCVGGGDLSVDSVIGYRFQLARNDSVNLQFSLVQFCTRKRKLKGQCHKIHKIIYLSSLSKAFSPQEQYLQNHHPLQRSEGGNLQTDAAQPFLFKPNSSEIEKAWSSFNL